MYNKSQKSGESLSQKIITYSRQDKKDKVKEKQDKPPIKKHYGTKILLDTLIGSLAILGFIKCCFMIQDEEQKVREYENTLRTRTVAESTYVPTNEVQEILNEFTPKKSLEDDIKHQINQSESLKKYDIKRGDHLTRVAKMVLKAGGNADESNSTINNMIYRIMGINGIKATADNDHLKKGPNGNVVSGPDSFPDRNIWNVGDTILLPNYNKTKGFITSQQEKVKQDPLKKFDYAQIKVDKKLENIAANSTSPEKKPTGLPDINNIIRDMYVKNHYLKTIENKVKKYVNDDVPEELLERRIINAIESGSKYINLQRNTFNTEIAKLTGDYSTIKDKLANGETYYNIKEYMANNAKARMNISNSTIYKIKKELKEEGSLRAA